MTGDYNLCIIKPNKNAFSETFITEHINRLKGNKKVLYGGSFPVYDDRGRYLIRSKINLLIYLVQKRIFRKKDIAVRNRALADYLKREKTDVVFAEYGTVGAMVTEACKMAKVPLVVNFHGADAHHQDTVNEFLPYYKKLFGYAYGIAAVSYDMVDELVKLGAPKDKVFWNPCGVDTALFKPLDLTGTKPNFLSVGRFVGKKSPEAVVKAFSLVAAEIPDAHLRMVGNGPLFEVTKELIKSLKLEARITLTGVLSSAKIRELFAHTRCFVQHSVTTAGGDKEGTPVTVLEAGSSGLAIVSTAHAGIKEAVISGETGYLVAEHDIEGMAGYMIRFGEDVNLARQMGAKEASHIRKNYDINDKIAVLDRWIADAVKQNSLVSDRRN